MKKILIVEDDPILNKNISESMQAEGYYTESVMDGKQADRILTRDKFDCVILDINLPGKSGYEICKNLRTHNKVCPVLLLTAFEELEDKVQGFQCGADDYLTKPFYMKELILRIQSLMRRSENDIHKNSNPEIVVTSDMSIQLNSGMVTRQNQEIQLTPREFQILLKLIQAKGAVVPKKELIKEIWGTAFDANTNTIEVYINFLRKKIDKPFGKDSIKTKIGYGYYFEDK